MSKTYEPYAGTSIHDAINEAIGMAKSGKCEVSFTFNGVVVVAKPDSNPTTLLTDWRNGIDAENEAYRNSPEGKQDELNRQTRSQLAIKAVNEAVARLPKVLSTKNLDKLMTWLSNFAASADHVDATFDIDDMVEQLEKAGYKSNEGVGQKPEWFNTRERMGRYIVGQALSCLKMGMPPHPMTVGFVESYFKIKA